MLFKFSVSFPQGAPTLEALRRQASDRSGLDVELQPGEGGEAELTHPEFKRPCELMVDPDAIAVMMDGGGWSYLHYITLAALIDLGGQYKGKKLPKFIDTKWKDRKWWQFLPRG